ncbi:MAG: hypothetical protein DI598_00050 [Pseudopedobacter saltans]|uniref:HTH araC/xylS-type domain-containing protein n=1 Tax=Pseudopedobacter saltans TaxID=151895 RepID=A0A2W5HAY8_9SPHI|nr:MAG: hypothetical protein DI598_00050 [Pseudopedobacter saltans]
MSKYIGENYNFIGQMKPKEEIPVHHIHTHLKDSFFVRFYQNLDDGSEIWMNTKHRDEYYILLVLENGSLKLNVDFQCFELNGRSVFYVKPGQIHDVYFFDGNAGWVIAVEPGFLHRSYRQELDNMQVVPNSLDDNEHFQLLQRMLQIVKNIPETSSPKLKKDLINSLVGVFIACFRKEAQSTAAIPERWQQLYNQFRENVSHDFLAVKKPSQYADSLHLSLSYLNEVVKSVSGFTVSYWINYEIVLEAKRLLYHTSLTIKEISYKLGYEDPAYLSRIFTNNTGLSPLSFRKKNRE